MSESLIGKITMRTLGLSPAKFVQDGKVTPIAQIYGIAQKIQIVEDKVRGDSFESIRGQFEAVNLETGEIYQSGTLYLPSGIHDLVASAVRGLDPDDRKAAIRFKLEIGVVKSSNPAGYSYEARNLVKASEVDPLADLRAAGGPPQIMGKPAAQLPASTTEAAKPAQAAQPAQPAKPAQAPAKPAQVAGKR
jgi:hypothetical protein